MPQKDVNEATQEKRNFGATIMSSFYRKLLTQNSMDNLTTDFFFNCYTLSNKTEHPYLCHFFPRKQQHKQKHAQQTVTFLSDLIRLRQKQAQRSTVF